MLDVVYLSAHLDDAVWSCGGTLYEQAQAGKRVLVVTLCAGDPPAGALSDFAQVHHDRWGVTSATAVAVRRKEDVTALHGLGVRWLHLPLRDAIYRAGPNGDWLYTSGPALFGDLHWADQAAWLPQVVGWLAALPGVTDDTQVWLPLGLGQHVDHQLTRAAGEAWGGGGARMYYEDYPYVAQAGVALGDGWHRQVQVLSGAAVSARLTAMACYASQISTFWDDVETMVAATAGWLQGNGAGVAAECKWKRRETE